MTYMFGLGLERVKMCTRAPCLHKISSLENRNLDQLNHSNTSKAFVNINPRSSKEESWTSSSVPRAAGTLSQSHRHKSITCFSGAVLIFLHHIPESGPNLWKVPAGSYQHSAAGEREGNAGRCRATEVMWWIGVSDTAGASIPSSLRMHINEGRGRPCVWLLLMDGVCSHTLCWLSSRCSPLCYYLPL